MGMRKGFGVSASGATAEDFRFGIAGAFTRLSGGGVRAGVLPAHQGPIVSARASMGVDVGAFNAVLTRAADGALPVSNDGVVTLALAAAPASNSRIDLIYVKHNDASKGDADSQPVLAVVTGNAAASPSKPTVPAGALELGTVLVPAGATTTQSSGVVVSTTAPYTAAAGGLVWLRSAAEQSAFAAMEGQEVLRLDSGAVLIRRGGAWVAQRPVRHQRSGAAIAGIGSPASVSADGPLLIQSGTARFFTTTSFGNEYGPTITFPDAFPTAVLSFVAQPIVADGLTTRDHAIDVLSTTQARVFYPGGSAATQRGFTWIAVGY